MLLRSLHLISSKDSLKYLQTPPRLMSCGWLALNNVTVNINHMQGQIQSIKYNHIQSMGQTHFRGTRKLNKIQYINY